MPGAGHRYFESAGYSHQLGKRSGLHLLHDLAALNLERDLADAELGRSLLVEKTAHDQRQHLPLAGRQGRKALLQPGHLRSFPPGIPILCEGCIDCPHQVCFPEGFG